MIRVRLYQTAIWRFLVRIEDGHGERLEEKGFDELDDLAYQLPLLIWQRARGWEESFLLIFEDWFLQEERDEIRGAVEMCFTGVQVLEEVEHREAC